MENKKREPWEVILLFIALVLFLLCVSSCTKEYSAEPVKKDSTYRLIIHPGRNK